MGFLIRVLVNALAIYLIVVSWILNAFVSDRGPHRRHHRPGLGGPGVRLRHWLTVGHPCW